METLTTMFAKLRRDRARYEGRWYCQAGFWITAVYRFGMWAHSRRNWFLRIPMWSLYRVLRFPLRIYNVQLWAGGADAAQIGAGFYLLHPNNIVIGSGVQIGEDCLLMHEVTLGTGNLPGRPRIGNGVDVYVGARILGGVVIGDRSMVGANCVVTRDVPPESVILAAPGRVIPRTLSPVASAADRPVKPDP
ncbi:MAG: serine acetyltransferase [Planctomycetota bacterium]